MVVINTDKLKFYQIYETENKTGFFGHVEHFTPISFSLFSIIISTLTTIYNRSYFLWYLCTKLQVNFEVSIVNNYYNCLLKE